MKIIFINIRLASVLFREREGERVSNHEMHSSLPGKEKEKESVIMKCSFHENLLVATSIRSLSILSYKCGQLDKFLDSPLLYITQFK